MIEDRLPEARILVIDDEEANVRLLRRVLEPAGFGSVESTNDPTAAAELVAEYQPDIVLLDLLMPKMNGFEVMDAIRSSLAEDDYLPILVLTSDHTQDAKRRALSGGAKDFLTKPLSPSEVRLRVRNLLETRFLQGELRNQNRRLEDRVRERTRELEEARLQTLLRLARAAEYRDDDTGEHTRRVGRGAARIAQALGLPDEEVEMLRLVAPLHDVGKIGVPDSILRSAKPLDPDQVAVMRTHTTIGHELLGGTGVPLLDRAAEIALTHHEQWDGDGYPAGLGGETIPLVGRIVSVADTFDALVSARPYKPAWTPARAIAEIRDSAGTRYDPVVVQAFVASVDKEPGVGR